MGEAARAGGGGAEILAVGFGATVTMWAAGYAGRIPPAVAPSWVLGLVMLGCLVGGGFVVGRWGSGRWTRGAAAGALSALLNLLILGSVLSSSDGVNRLHPSALVWVPGSIALGALLGALGAAVGRSRSVATPRVAWTAVFTRVAVAATVLLVVAGGLVTSHKAGLAVVDWPNSFGYNMFLYPLSRMTGGVYYEHAHRLFGSLVGLTTLALAVHLWRVESRSWLRRLASGAVVLVVLQGVLGGLRVTGGFTLSSSPEAMAPRITLAVAHGVLGQLFLAVVVAIAAFASEAWSAESRRRSSPAAGADRALTAALVATLFVQLVLGAVQRHVERGLLIHITLAVAVLLLAVLAGVRLMGLYRDQPILRRIGRALLVLVTAQITLGFGSLAAVASRAGEEAFRSWDVLVRTSHQATGALLLAVAVLAALWTRRRLLSPAA